MSVYFVKIVNKFFVFYAYKIILELYSSYEKLEIANVACKQKIVKNKLSEISVHLKSSLEKLKEITAKYYRIKNESSACEHTNLQSFCSICNKHNIIVEFIEKFIAELEKMKNNIPSMISEMENYFEMKSFTPTETNQNFWELFKPNKNRDRFEISNILLKNAEIVDSDFRKYMQICESRTEATSLYAKVPYLYKNCTVINLKTKQKIMINCEKYFNDDNIVFIDSTLYTFIDFTNKFFFTYLEVPFISPFLLSNTLINTNANFVYLSGKEMDNHKQYECGIWIKYDIRQNKWLSLPKMKHTKLASLTAVRGRYIYAYDSIEKESKFEVFDTLDEEQEWVLQDYKFPIPLEVQISIATSDLEFLIFRDDEAYLFKYNSSEQKYETSKFEIERPHSHMPWVTFLIRNKDN